MRDKRGPYSTRQQAALLKLLRAHAGEARTIDEICSALGDCGIEVGRTTVYRALNKLSSEGGVIQVSDVRGGPSRFCLVDGAGTYLACLACHRVFPLSCDGFETFVRHISSEHDFDLQLQRTVLYGYCRHCAHVQGQGAEPA